MHQNYNSLLSPKKNLPKNQFHFRPSKALPAPAARCQPCRPSSQKLLRLPRENLIKEIELFNWRSKTSLPILKIADYAVFPLVQPPPSKPIFSTEGCLLASTQKGREEAPMAEILQSYMASHAEVLEYEVRVRAEEVRCTLQDIDMLPMPQLIYLLKEALIGFEVLIDIFGRFEPSQRMVVVNQRQQWKVWINEDYIASSKRNCNWNEADFIRAILQAVELHSNHNSQSKHLFQMLGETTHSNDCSFIRVLEKINEFVAVNKIFTVNKVLLTSERILAKESFLNSCNLADGLAASNVRNIKRDLQKLTSPVFQRSTPNKTTLLNGNNNRSATNLFDRNTHGLVHSPSYTKLQPYPKLNQSITYNIFSPKYSRKEERQIDNWERVEKNAMQVSKFVTQKHIPSLDYSQILHSPSNNNNSFQSRPNFNNKGNTNVKQPPPVPSDMKRTTLTNTSPSKNRTDMKQLVQEKPKPVSKVEQPQKRNNKRKYSQQIIQIKSLDNLTKKEKYGHISNIYNPNDTLKSFSKHHEGVMVSTPTTKTLKQLQESPDVKCISSPNNSSSTKEIQQSGEIKSNYIKLKMNDLGGDKPKNNQSVINPYTITTTLSPEAKKDKNMAASYQFQSKDCSSSGSERSLKKGHVKKKETKWSNKISGLFSDNMSIKHLKESIKIKTKEQQHFQKEYLKDIKLDLLEKFGRKVNHMVEEQDGKHLNAQYKSMQLIQQELQQGKSYLQDQKIEDFPKENRSKHMTMQINHHPFQLNLKETSLKDHHSSYDDNDLSSEIASSSSGDGFNFETEMYVINRQQ